MDLTNLHALSASDAARLIREGVLSSVQVVEACLARIREVDADVQAWAFLDPQHALEQARAADEWRAGGRPTGPLHGVPVGVKDIIDTGDMPTEVGSPIYLGRTPSRDAAVVSMLRGAGAVIMGKTVTTEFATYAPGKTRNPHDAAHTPGGSSSGSAAAVAAGMVPVALGSQTNGSVIRPASFCGVYGFKPTHGLIPRPGVFQLSRTLDTVGVFARAVDDVALLLEQLVGFDERDPDSRPRARIPFRDVAAEEPPLPPMFGLARTSRWERTDTDTREAFAELEALLGDRVEDVDLIQADDAFEWHRVIMEAEMAASLDREWEKGRDQLSDRPPDAARAGARDTGPRLSAGAHAGAALRGRARRDVHGALRRHPHARRAGHRAAQPRVDRGSELLHAVDAHRDAGHHAAPHAGRQRPPDRRPAGRPPPRRRPPPPHRPLARLPRLGGVRLSLLNNFRRGGRNVLEVKV